jgi:hypothetical protein
LRFTAFFVLILTFVERGPTPHRWVFKLEHRVFCNILRFMASCRLCGGHALWVSGPPTRTDRVQLRKTVRVQCSAVPLRDAALGAASVAALAAVAGFIASRSRGSQDFPFPLFTPRPAAPPPVRDWLPRLSTFGRSERRLVIDEGFIERVEEERRAEEERNLALWDARFTLRTKTLPELKSIARRYDIVGRSRMRKGQLVAAIEDRSLSDVV